jgi:hypothetical protein
MYEQQLVRLYRILKFLQFTYIHTHTRCVPVFTFTNNSTYIIIIISLSVSPLLEVFLMNYTVIRRTGHNPPRGPSADWWVQNVRLYKFKISRIYIHTYHSRFIPEGGSTGISDITPPFTTLYPLIKVENQPKKFDSFVESEVLLQ